ncbi:hypothetical protein FRC01_008757, partial [Tulasnella sp. 417]
VHDLLAPAGLEQRYRQHRPFFFNMLELFTKSPNRYQRRKGFKSPPDEGDLDGDSEQGDESEGEAPSADDSPAGESAGGSRPNRATV